ncbi:MAG: hypothetical protein Pg6A_04920 [Termitinemataceae bacterium]|nr:MAG: hypothetical protein Pg6A_04920 [Termitinemataceae bacterium]
MTIRRIEKILIWSYDDIMMRQLRKIISVTSFIMFCFVCASCSTVSNLVEKGGKTLDGSMFEFKTEQYWRPLDGSALDLRIGKDKNGNSVMMWTHSELPYLTFYGTIPDKTGKFYVTSVHFIAGNYNGWNEFKCIATGRGRFRDFGMNNAAWTLLSPIERGEINYGKIRRDDTRLVEERAVSALRGRDERIRYLTPWMRKEDGTSFESQDDFERYWKPRLFPRGKKQKLAAPALPELLQSKESREALQSDWEEASSWIYVDYNWKKITLPLNNEYIITKK